VFNEVVETGDCAELDLAEDGFFEGFGECLIYSLGCAFLAHVNTGCGDGEVLHFVEPPSRSNLNVLKLRR
jgi:hypothetical protein